MAKKNNGNALVTFEVLTEFYHELIRPHLDRIEKLVQQNSDNIYEIKTELRYVKNDIDGIKADISTNPTRAEFNELKSEVRSISS